MSRGVLLDTNVVSETRKRTPDAAVVAWLRDLDPMATFLSVLTIGELRRGAFRLSLRDAERARGLERWIYEIETQFGDRLLHVDLATAGEWARLPASRTLPVIDSLLVATAAAHGLMLATRNVRDVAGLGVDVVDPWKLRDR